MAFLALLIFGVGCKAQEISSPIRATTSCTVYDANPAHILNRLHATLFSPTGPDATLYGLDDLDPLLFPRTKHLLVDRSHEDAIKVLDEFLSKPPERVERAPLKRAILQRDLLAVFDWVATWNWRAGTPEPAGLQRRRTGPRQPLNRAGCRRNRADDDFRAARLWPERR